MRSREVIQLEAAHRGRAAELLARAFHEDPLYVLVEPREDRRARVLAWLFDRVVGDSLRHGLVYTTPAVEGVACWLAPGQVELTAGRVLGSGLWTMPFRMGWAAYRRFATYLSYAERFHKRHAPDRHWYLLAIGVDPGSQGKGLGGGLLQPMLNRASAEGRACYLETGTERNLRFYEKHGFRVAGEGTVPGQDLPVWALLRGPVGA